MVLHTQYFMLLFITCIFYLNMCSCFDTSSDSEEEDKLKQALLLIEILRSEYIKSLRSHSLREHQEIDNVTNYEESTCAMTTDINATTVAMENTTEAASPQRPNLTSPEMWNSNMPTPFISTEVPTTTVRSWYEMPPSSPSYFSNSPNEQMREQDFNTYRRKGNYINDADEILQSQQQYRRKGGNEKDLQISNTKSTKKATSTISKMATIKSKLYSSKVIFNKKGAHAIPKPKKMPPPKVYPSRRQLQKTFDKGPILNQVSQELSNTNLKKGYKKNHVMNQVATELLNEVKAIRSESKNITNDLNTNGTSSQATTVRDQETKKDEPKRDEPNKEGPNKDEPNKDGPNKDEPNKDEPNKELYGKKAKLVKNLSRTTLKIYLERSTKMSVPLSENNAFCFLSPKSPLCPTNLNE